MASPQHGQGPLFPGLDPHPQSHLLLRGPPAGPQIGPLHCYLRISNRAPPTAKSLDPARHSSWADVRPGKEGLLLDQFKFQHLAFQTPVAQHLAGSSSLLTQQGSQNLSALTRRQQPATVSARLPILLALARRQQPAIVSSNSHVFLLSSLSKASNFARFGKASTTCRRLSKAPKLYSLWQGINNMPRAWQGSQILPALARRQQPAPGLARLPNFACFGKASTTCFHIIKTSMFLILARPPATASADVQTAPSIKETSTGPP